MPEIDELIKGLTPGALRIFKQKIAGLPEEEKQKTFSAMSGIPELKDITGTPDTVSRFSEWERGLTPETEIPLWQSALSTVTAPFRWFEEHVTQPFGAIATSPFTPSIEGTEGMGWLERERAEYKAWDDPNWGFLGVKGVVELLPWLAVPAIGTVGGAAGGAAARGIAGTLGRLGTAGKVVGKALEYSPYGLMEKGAGLVLKPVSKITGAAISKFASLTKKIKPTGEVSEEIGKEVSKRVDITPIESTAGNRYGLSVDGKPVGEVTYGSTGAIAENGMIIADIEIISSARRKGIASDVLDAVLREAEANNKTLYSGLLKPDGEKWLNGLEEKGLINLEKAEQPLLGSKIIRAETKKAIEAARTGEKITPIKPPIMKELPVPEEPEFSRFWKAISGKKASNAWTATQDMRSAELSRRADAIQARLADIPPEKLTQEMYEKVWQELGTGALPSRMSKMGFTEEFADAGIRRINEVLADKPYEAKATVTAFLNALEGKPVPRVPGTKGGSAFSRLARVFGEEAAEILASPKKMEKLASNMLGSEPAQIPAEVLTYLRNLPEIPRTQSSFLGQMFSKEGAQIKFLDPFDPEVLTLSTREILERLGQGAVKDERSLAQKQLDYWALQRAAGKITTEPPILPAFPSNDLAKQLALLPIDQRTKIAHYMQAAGKNIVDLANAPRTLMTSFDISGLFRQGAILFAFRPVEGYKSIAPMVKALFSDANAAAVEAAQRQLPHFAHAQKYNLYIAPSVAKTAKVAITMREEGLMSSWMLKIPGIKHSARAYVTGLNELRLRIWESVLTSWEKMGVKVAEQDYKDLAQLINWASGRGSMPKLLVGHGGLLNAFLFSPRLIMSRLQFPLAVLPGVTKSALVRKQAMQMLMSFTGAGATILMMGKASGVFDVELDPRSADFGKLKVGDTRLDIWTGYAQYCRLAANLITSQKKTEGGLVYSVNRKEILDRFSQTKLSPAMGLLNDLLKGETYLGEELPPKSATGVLGQMYQRLAPLAIQDMIDAYNQGGGAEAFIASSGLLGIGVVTYTDELKKARNKVANDKYGLDWDEVGLRYGRKAQLELEQTSQELIDAEHEQEKRYAAGSPSTMRQWQREGESIEQTYRDSITKASAEFKTTQNGALFRDKVDQAATTRRQMYAARAKRKEYQDIVNYYNQPLSQERLSSMNPGDVARREYYRMMYGDDMYDQYGNYLFELADQRERGFISKFGQAALDYIDSYQGSQWLDKPAELMQLEQARDIMAPYWDIVDYVWAMYPPELKELSNQITILEMQDPARARQALKQFPQILRARELIAMYKKALRDQDPRIAQAYQLFYS
jgi:predicted GNAT family acetyltransferase